MEAVPCKSKHSQENYAWKQRVNSAVHLVHDWCLFFCLCFPRFQGCLCQRHGAPLQDSPGLRNHGWHHPTWLRPRVHHSWPRAVHTVHPAEPGDHAIEQCAARYGRWVGESAAFSSSLADRRNGTSPATSAKSHSTFWSSRLWWNNFRMWLVGSWLQSFMLANHFPCHLTCSNLTWGFLALSAQVWRQVPPELSHSFGPLLSSSSPGLIGRGLAHHSNLVIPLPRSFAASLKFIDICVSF